MFQGRFLICKNNPVLTSLCRVFDTQVTVTTLVTPLVCWFFLNPCIPHLYVLEKINDIHLWLSLRQVTHCRKWQRSCWITLICWGKTYKPVTLSEDIFKHYCYLFSKMNTGVLIIYDIWNIDKFEKFF